VGDDDPDLATDPVVAVGHRRHEPFVLAHHQPLIAILGESREDPGLRRTWVREEILDPRILQDLDQQHPAGAGNSLAHDLPRLSSRSRQLASRSTIPGGEAARVRHRSRHASRERPRSRHATGERHACVRATLTRVSSTSASRTIQPLGRLPRRNSTASVSAQM
jgi:hypothetical protein